MPVDPQALGSKLRKYREQLQESVQDVSRSTGIASDRLAGIEGGSIRPTGDEILILADHWSCDFGVLLTNERSAPFEEAEILYRRHGEAFSKEDRRAVQEFLYLCETEAFLFRELERAASILLSHPKALITKATVNKGRLLFGNSLTTKAIDRAFRETSTAISERSALISSGGSSRTPTFRVFSFRTPVLVRACWLITARMFIDNDSALLMRWLTPSSIPVSR